MSRIIEISVKDRIAWQTNRVEYICDNSDFVVDFDFDSEWEGVEPKTARFIHGEQYTDVVFMGNRCPVPVITDVTKMQVGVFAGNLQTTTPVTIICKNSILCGDGVPADPTPDVYTQIMEVIVPEAVLNAEASAQVAAQAEKNAKESESNAAGSAQSAKNAETNAKTSEENAVNAQNTAVEAVRQAELSKQNAEQSAKAAENSAKSSADYAKQAAHDAVRAYTNFVDAEKKALLASGSAERAQNSATAAETSAKRAEEAAEKAESGSGSGVEVTAKPGQLIRVKETDENGNPTAWEAVPWGYTEGGMVEILPETAFAVADDGETAIVHCAGAPEIVIGETYTVNFRGTPYQCVAFGLDIGFEVEMPFLGNASMYGGVDTGEPFMAIYLPENFFGDEEPSPATIEVVALDGLADGTVSIYHNAETPHPIPGELLPEGVPYVEKGGMVEILPMTELTLNVDNFPINTKIEGVEVGKSYVVNYNGTEYTCVGQDFTMIPGAVALGDMSGFTGEPGTGEPFLIMILPDEMFEQMGVGGQVIAIDGAETLSISLSAVDETLHKVDPRLLPDDLVKDILIVNVATLDGDFYPATASHTGSDLKNACLFGKKAALFAYNGKTLPLISVSDTEVTAEFGNIYFSNGSLLRDYVVIDVDGNISTYEMGETVTI